MRPRTYVRAAAYRTDAPTDDRTRVTGRVLHLAVWAPAPRGAALLHGAGRHTPLCGSPIPRAVDAWVPTGPTWPGWDGHAHWPVCHHCVRAMDRLLFDLNAQDDRTEAHQGVSPAALTLDAGAAMMTQAAEDMAAAAPRVQEVARQMGQQAGAALADAIEQTRTGMAGVGAHVAATLASLTTTPERTDPA